MPRQATLEGTYAKRDFARAGCAAGCRSSGTTVCNQLRHCCTTLNPRIRGLHGINGSCPVWTLGRASSAPAFGQAKGGLSFFLQSTGKHPRKGFQAQSALAEDTGLTESRVSRTLRALEQAGYIRRKVRRIYNHSQRWIGRVTLHLRPRFFIDLGLGHALAEARTGAKKRRERQLKEAHAPQAAAGPQ